MADNDRLEREIEEILGKIEQFPDQESRVRRARRRTFSRWTSRIAEVQRGVARRLGQVSISQLMLLSFLMILFALFFRGRGLPAMASSWVLLAGVILFISTFAVTMLGPRARTRSVEQRWRGRTIQYGGAPSVLDRLKHWWAARSHRR